MNLGIEKNKSMRADQLNPRLVTWLLVTVFALFTLEGSCELTRCTLKEQVPILQKNPIAIDVNGWLSHEMMARVGATILREAMGFNVSLVAGTGPSSFDRMVAEDGSKDKVHMNLEVWASDSAYDTLINEGVKRVVI